MVGTVLEKESFLFSKEELDFFVAYKGLSCACIIKFRFFVASFNINSADNARYLLARLLVRKVGKWFRLKDLKYVSELGVEGIEGAIDELCHLSETKHLTSGELSSGGQSIVDSSSAEHQGP